MKYAIGIDIGGTKISLVLGAENGKLLQHLIVPTHTRSRTQNSIQDIQKAVRALLAFAARSKKKVAGIGIGIPGPVDSIKGIVPRSPHLKGWEGLRLRKILSRAFKLPVYMNNDANAAALGEKIFGKGKKVSNLIYITVSTGIGGGLIIRNKLFEGASFVAGEVGHMTIVPKGALCKCGKHGCLEAYASGTAIARLAREKIGKRGMSAVLRRLTEEENELSAKVLSHAARRRDPLALEVFEEAGACLGIGIANLLNIINPELVVLGGGVMKNVPQIFWTAMMRSCKKQAWPEAFKAVRIDHSGLKGFVGDLGALALVFENSE